MDEDEFVAAGDRGTAAATALLRVRRPTQPASCARCSTSDAAAAARRSTRSLARGAPRERCCSTLASPPTSPPGTCAAPSTSGSRVASPSGPATSWRPTATSCSSVTRRPPSKPRSAWHASGTTGSSGSSTTRRGRSAGRPDLIETSSRLTIEQLAELRGLEPGLQLVDVRSPAETAAGTLPGAREIPLAVLTDSLAGLDPQGSVVVYCASGYRSLIAASVLADAGFVDVSDLLGGYGAWEGADCRPRRATPPATSALRPRSAPARRRHSSTPAPCSSTCASRRVAGRACADGDARADGTGARHDCPSFPATARSSSCAAPAGARQRSPTSLRAWGFDAVNLSGGMCAWAAAGLPVATAADAGLVVHRDEPLNCETSIPALIGGVVMPNARFYVRNHFPTPTLDVTTWRLDGERSRRASVALEPARSAEHAARKRSSPRSSAPATDARCSSPPVDGEQWRLGAVSTAEWTGVPLVEVLDRAGAATGRHRRSCSAAPTPGASRGRRSRSTSSVACRSTTRAAPRRCSPTR